eukprot:Plantae.Rhodophyta-Rhodochaete_pulchella.ctg10798.p1 GENE.Plantae.Rhodophyta-Rhodochaete_pulchella.ctg10798~~Plantae.Rhodophyta-Rhodochaete_pulchella.ctg10798.p1  ORF type:complete len:208 (+),score=18.18 Plantae.Rhodophyta-Rhodochaete_pulchella.ctg10798:628-1251(+)
MLSFIVRNAALAPCPQLLVYNTARVCIKCQRRLYRLSQQTSKKCKRRKPEARTYPPTMKVIITVALIALLGAAFAIPEVDEELNETAEHVVARCGNYCRFKFCDGQEAFLIGAPEISLTDAICHKRGRSIGLVSETGEAQVSRGRRPLKDISRYRPNGLSQRFSPSFFKSYTRPVTGTSGVGHETPRGNQVSLASESEFEARRTRMN